MAADGLEAQAQAADTGKQVNKPKAPGRLYVDRRKAQILLERCPPLRRIQVSEFNGTYRSRSPGTTSQKFKITIIARTHAARLDQNMNMNKSRTSIKFRHPHRSRRSPG